MNATEHNTTTLEVLPVIPKPPLVYYTRETYELDAILFFTMVFLCLVIGCVVACLRISSQGIGQLSRSR